MIRRLSRCLAVLLAPLAFAAVEPTDLRLPTENHALLNKQPDKFYMYVERTFEGQTTKPWEAGSFGFVRSPIRVGAPPGEVVLTKFHEGNDICPVQRDKAGSPLDPVCAISQGTVAYCSMVAGHSNYGKYVVVEHRWNDSPVYSLYAHLSEIHCKPGDQVKAGSVLGKMGFTGEGLTRARAHLHLEITMLLSERFEDWHKIHSAGQNYHGLFNGMNLAGVDPAGFFLGHRANPDLSFVDYVSKSPVYFRVTLPRTEPLAILKRYPWLLRGSPDIQSASWEIAFHATGYPISITPSDRVVPMPCVTSVRASKVPHRYLTRGLVNGEGSNATLTPSGHNLVDLITDSFPAAPATPPATPARSKHSARDADTDDSEH
jgi:murein DD-endopeptidase MepM/ murein hydrolase activator NlpD